MLACVSLCLCCALDWQIPVQVVFTGICKHVAIFYSELHELGKTKFSCNYALSSFPTRPDSLREKQIGIYITYRIKNDFSFMQLKNRSKDLINDTLFPWCCGPTRAMAYSILSFLITHNDAPHSVGLLWTSDQLISDTSIWQHTTLITKVIHAPGGIRTHISIGERPQTHTLDCETPGIGTLKYHRYPLHIYLKMSWTIIHRICFPLDPYKCRRIF
jgi:uncharacterized protein (DUF779 family)